MSTSRRSVVAGVGLSVVAGVAGGWLSQRTSFRAEPAAGAGQDARLATAQVVRTDLRTTRQFYGTIGYGPTVDLVATASGRAFTWLPAPGAIIEPDGTVYEADGRAVPVLPGARPMWRALHRGLRGLDVIQLNTALARLGYPAVTGSPLYSWRTETAVRRWQRAHRLPRTGSVDLGQLVFAAAPLRVNAVQAKLGEPVQPGIPLLSATSPALLVDVPVPVDQAYLLHRGAAVIVTLPDAVTTTPGVVAAVARVATLPDADTQNARNGNPGAAVVNAAIRLLRPSLAAAYSSAPVQVAITLNEVKGVLAVPITALLARPDGGFAVTVANRGDVPVQTGVSSDTLVQVSGSGITAGTRVVVAAS